MSGVTAPTANIGAGRKAQPWLNNWLYDGALILAPAFLSSIFALLIGAGFKNTSDLESLPTIAWVLLVLMVDVAHVYATLFRTYMDDKARQGNGTLLFVIPLACYIVGVIFYSMDGLFFWRCLAYLAVFHFIRQQYGFLVLYSRGEGQTKWARLLDQAVIYAATLYPLIYWHSNLPRHFNWFVEGDFYTKIPAIDTINFLALILYAALALIYLLKEATGFARTGFINIPRNLLVLGTSISWWVGIVATNCDLIFTMTNVLSHGIPYMALVWLYHRRKAQRPDLSNANDIESEAKNDGSKPGSSQLLLRFTQACLTFAPLFFLFLVFLAYLEEGLWDGMVWREHLTLFAPFSALPHIEDKTWLALLVPFLSLPQSTHYVLDGFIWRVKDRDSTWSA